MAAFAGRIPRSTDRERSSRSACCCSRKKRSAFAISTADHPLERDAERAATAALARDAAPALSLASAAPGIVVRSSDTCGEPRGSLPETTADLVESALTTPGLPLSVPTRANMESRFGVDFGRVRIHTDERAAASARALQALAYTRRNDIVFAPGRYQPETTDGVRLLAHELAHTVQGSDLVARQVPAGAHVAGAPQLRPVAGDTVRGFPVGERYCSCRSDVDQRRVQIGRLIASFETCRKGPQDDIAGLYACATLKAYGRMDVPAGAATDPHAGRVLWPTPEERQKRAELLGEASQCAPLLTWGTLVHESEHLEQFNQIAAKLGAAFFAEFQRLEGQEDRLEQLAKRFPKETARYRAETQEANVTRNQAAGMETGALQKEDAFYSEVKAVLDRICPADVPQPRVARPPGR